MTLKTPTGRIRTLLCDHPGCTWEFKAARYQDRVPTVRAAARECGWFCRNPGPGKPALDLCPRHWTDPRKAGRK